MIEPINSQCRCGEPIQLDLDQNTVFCEYTCKACKTRWNLVIHRYPTKIAVDLYYMGVLGAEPLPKGES
jgi:hypothetical protein